MKFVLKVLKILCVVTLAMPNVYAAVVPEENKVGKPYADNVVPGVIEAEDFNIGENSIAYYDGTESKATVYRTDTDVEIYAYKSNYTVMPYTKDWMNYTVNALVEGKYVLWATCYDGTGNGSAYTVYVNGKKILDNAPVAPTLNNAYSEVELGTIELEKGRNVIKIEQSKGYGGIESMRFIRKRIDNNSQLAYFNRKVPCMIIAQNYDMGGRNVSFWNKNQLTKNFFRNDTVNFFEKKNEGYVLLKENEWINYTVSNGDYTSYGIILSLEGENSDVSILKDGKEVARGNLDACGKCSINVGTVTSLDLSNTYTVKVNSGEIKLYSVKFDVNNANTDSKKYIRLKNIDTENPEALQPEYFEKILYISSGGTGNGEAENPACFEKALEIFADSNEKMTGNWKFVLKDGIYDMGILSKIKENHIPKNNYKLYVTSENKNKAVFCNNMKNISWGSYDENTVFSDISEIPGGVVSDNKLLNICKSKTYSVYDTFENGIAVNEKVEFLGTGDLKAVWSIGNRTINFDIEKTQYSDGLTKIYFDENQYKKVFSMNNKEIMPSKGTEFCFKNDLSFLSKDTFCYDTDKNKIYCYKNLNMNETDIIVCGTQESAVNFDNISNTVFSDIHFLGGAGMKESFSSLNADYNIYTDEKLVSTFNMNNCSNIVFNANTFSGFCATVFNIADNCSDIEVSDNVFSYTGGSAISIGYPYENIQKRINGASDGIFVKRNTFENT